MEHHNLPDRDDSGFSLVELMLGTSVLVLGVLALMSSMMSSVLLARDTREANVANDEAQTVIETFRDACNANFTGGVQAVLANPSRSVVLPGIGAKATVSSSVVLDETSLSPRMDLNGDGDTIDTNLSPSELAVAYIQTTVNWEGGKGERKLSFVNVLARPGGAPSNPNANGQSQPGGTTGGKGGGTSGGSSSGNASVAVSNFSVSGKGDAISMDLAVTGGEMSVTSITVASSEPAYVKQINVEGAKVFSQKANAPATGSEIQVSPFFLSEGLSSLDQIKFMATPNGGFPQMGSASFTITFHLDNGETVSFSAP